jgi:menaquinol-cytochrome c reductase iron-sulfur subunit
MSEKNPSSPTPDTPRRNFLVEGAAVLIGTIIMAVPVLSGLWVFTDPLRRKKGNNDKFLKIATLDAVPDDGVPRLFSIFRDRVDAWNMFKQEPVGSVFVARDKESKKLRVLHTTCPHLGCSISLTADQSKFLCPCHNSSFELNGVKLSTTSPRDMDELAYEIRGAAGQEEIWVAFENYRTGSSQKEVA